MISCLKFHGFSEIFLCFIKLGGSLIKWRDRCTINSIMTEKSVLFQIFWWIVIHRYSGIILKLILDSKKNKLDTVVFQCYHCYLFFEWTLERQILNMGYYIYLWTWKVILQNGLLKLMSQRQDHINHILYLEIGWMLLLSQQLTLQTQSHTSVYFFLISQALVETMFLVK